MVQISDEKLLKELQRCYDENGTVSGSILNDSNNDYPTQPTYSYRFDGGFTEACEKAGVPHGNSTNCMSRDEIISAAEKHFNENGEFGVKSFNVSDELPSTKRMYKLFDSIDNLISEMDNEDEVRRYKENMRKLAGRSRQDYTYNHDDKDALIEHLLWVQNEYGDTKTRTVDESAGPSSTVYSNVFGSIMEARREAGLFEPYNKSYKDRIGELPENVDLGADTHIYTILLAGRDKPYYYIGKSNNLERRLTTHSSGESKVYLYHECEYDTLRELDMYVESIVSVKNMYKKENESENQFRERVKCEEHIKSHKVSVAFETHRVLGGRS